MADWEKIKKEYIKGGTSYRKLVEKYNVSFSTLKNVANREEWRKLREKARKKKDTLLAERIGEKNGMKCVIFDEIADTLLLRIKEGIDDGTLLADKSRLKDLTSAIKDLKDIKGIKSEADTQEQWARIEKLRREAQAYSQATDEGNNAGVLIMPCIMPSTSEDEKDE